MKEKKVGFYCPNIYPCKTGGLEVFTYYLVKEISKKQKVYLFTQCNKVEDANIKVYRVFSKLFIIRRFYLGALSTLISLGCQLIKTKVSLFHVPHTNNSDSLGLIFPIIKKLFDAEYIVVLHGGNVEKFKQTFLQTLLMKHAKNIVAVSEASAEDYRKLIPHKIDVIPSLIPFFHSRISKGKHKAKFNLPIDAKVVLMVGSIKPIKCVETTIKAFIELGGEYIKNNKLYLVIAGDGEQKYDLEKHTNELNLRNIVFVGNIAYEKLHEVYEMADIYVIASLFESLSKTLLEAMFNELPIIGSNVNVINKIITDKRTGLLFEVNNHHDLSRKMRTLIDNPDYAYNLGQEAKKEYSSRFNYQKTLKDYEHLYYS